MRLGIDVSKYQGDIDWERTKNVVDFAIIRCGYGSNLVSQDDQKFRRNADLCTQLKIPFGVYLYSYATTVANAQSEALHTLRLIKDYKLEYPVYIDIEEQDQLSLPQDQLVAIVKKYCEMIEDAGYYVGIYASLSVFNGILNSEELDRYDKWVAEWNQDFHYRGKCGMWQYTNNLGVAGIDGRTDGDKAFYNYPEIIRKNGLNHLETGEEQTPVPTPVPTKEPTPVPTIEPTKEPTKEPEPPTSNLKYNVGDKIYLNGILYGNEMATVVEEEFENQEFVIDEVNTSDVEAPYKISLTGYVKEESISKEKKSKDSLWSKIIKIIKKLFKKWK